MLDSDGLIAVIFFYKFAKNTSLETKFPSPFGSGNFSSFDWSFSQIPLPNMIYLYNIMGFFMNFELLLILTDYAN